MSDDLDVNDEVTESEDAVTEVVDPRSEVERQRDEYLDALQRLQAEFENYRKRVARTSEDAVVRATGDLVVRLLPVLDAFDLAQAHFADSSSDEALALSQARGVLLDTLAKEGLERVGDVGDAFDPQVHDAVAHVESESDDGQVIDEILRVGYRWKGGVLRPAMVKVKG